MRIYFQNLSTYSPTQQQCNSPLLFLSSSSLHALACSRCLSPATRVRSASALACPTILAAGGPPTAAQAFAIIRYAFYHMSSKLSWPVLYLHSTNVLAPIRFVLVAWRTVIALLASAATRKWGIPLRTARRKTLTSLHSTKYALNAISDSPRNKLVIVSDH